MEAVRHEERLELERQRREVERLEALRLEEESFEAERRRKEAERVETLKRDEERFEAQRTEARTRQQAAHAAEAATGSVRLNAFSAAELRAATEDFAVHRRIGEGGFGPVFSGQLRGARVAVKQLDRAGLQVRPAPLPTSKHRLNAHFFNAPLLATASKQTHRRRRAAPIARWRRSLDSDDGIPFPPTPIAGAGPAAAGAAGVGLHAAPSPRGAVGLVPGGALPGVRARGERRSGGVPSAAGLGRPHTHRHRGVPRARVSAHAVRAACPPASHTSPTICESLFVCG